MLSAVRRFFDGLSEREALQLLEADMPVIHRWKIGVTHRIDKRRGPGRANLAQLRCERARRSA